MLRPWPPQRERHAAIAAATEEKERSQASATKAREIERQIARMAAENHFASTIIRQIRGER